VRSEFQFINDIKSRYYLSKVGDDCAVLPKDDETDLLITSDMLVEAIDFRLDWSTHEQLGHKALAVSLSDIAAMGGTPKYAILSIAVVENLWKGDFLDRFYDGWHRLARNYGVELVGGDVSRTFGPLTIDSTVLGEIPKGKAVLRSGARPGDLVFGMGTLGPAAGGLKILTEGTFADHPEAASLIEWQLTPLPEINGGKYLRQHGLATSMIDVSDGLSSDIAHICRASGVGAEIHAELLPIDPAIRAIFGEAEASELAVNGGEDFRLLFTSSDPRVEQLLGVSRIGKITATPNSIEILSSGRRRPLQPKGYRHFFPRLRVHSG